MSKSVTKTEIIKVISQEAHITVKAATTAVNLVFGFLHDTVAEEKTITLPGVGVLSGYLRPPRIVVNPRTGEKMMGKQKLLVRLKSTFKQNKVH